MKHLYSLGLLMLTCAASFAQEKGNIKGSLIDTAMKQPVGDATITIMKASDSSLVTFSRSNSKGDFTVGYLDKGKYRVLITHVTYRNVSRFFEINETTKSIDLGYIPLTNKSAMLDAVQVVQEAAPVTMKNDTVEYNAGSFKTKPNAVVEDLLKKLPGVQVDKDGKIKANGEEVKKVLVDGKQFFGNDPKTATKNLPADVVDKVQVFDKKSDQSQFTGFDDGNSEKTINLTIKPNKKNGVFGKATAGGGTEGRYQGNFNINQFSGDRQFSAIGMANNTNKQGFSFVDVLNFSGGLGAPGGKGGQVVFNTGGLPIQGMNSGNNGLTTTWAGGLNFNDTYNKKVEVSGSYFYNRIENDVNQKINREYLIPGNTFTRVQESNSNIVNENHRFNFMSDYKIDSMNSLKYTTSANVQQSSSANHSDFSSTAPKGFLLNDGFSSTNAESNGYSWDNNLLWRHKFSKKGRTFSSSFSFNASEGDNKNLLNSLTKFYQSDGTINAADTIDQVNKQNMQSRTYGAILSYTEPLSRKSLLEFNYNFNQNNSNSGRETYDLDPITGNDPVKNELLSNDFVNRYQSNQGGISWRYQDSKYNISISNFIQTATMQTDFHFLGFDSSLNKQFLNHLPTARFQYAINKYRNLRFDYYTSTQAPSAIQLNPIVDLSDPLNIRVGNPNLSQEYTHRLTFHYLSFDPFRRTSFFSMLNYSTTNNRIVSYDQIDSQGVRKTSYINVDGVYSILGSASWGLPVKPIKSNLNLSTNIVQSWNINFINTERNIINSWNVTQDVSLNFVHKEILDITAGANVSYNRVRYSLPGQADVNYWNQEYSLDMNVYFPHGISLASEFTFTKNTGYADGYNTNVSLWNLGLVKQLFKNKKGEIKAQVFDILNQNVGISRNANQNYIEDVQTRILSRYFLLSFTYNISRFAGKSAPKMQEGNIKIIGEKVRM
jgi:hypothetical protein